jgi:hypothetical protein
MRKLFVSLFILFACDIYAQLYVGPFLGGAGYNGDLNEKALKRIKPAVGIAASYQLSNRLFGRLGLTLTGLEGGDKWSGTDFLKQNRNLSFKTDLTEISLSGEFNFFNLNKKSFTPYVFGGIALFHFDPYVIDSGKRVYLKPLGTEGQGLPGMPQQNAYALYQLALPFGGGFKYVLTNNLILSFELNIRRTNTDYLDDVSTNYADGNAILNYKGETAFRFSYRGGEVPGGIADYPDNDYPLAGSQRGGAKYKDWYYTAGFHLLFRFDRGWGKAGREKKNYGCVTTIQPM